LQVTSYVHCLYSKCVSNVLCVQKPVPVIYTMFNWFLQKCKRWVLLYYNSYNPQYQCEGCSKLWCERTFNDVAIRYCHHADVLLYVTNRKGYSKFVTPTWWILSNLSPPLMNWLSIKLPFINCYMNQSCCYLTCSCMNYMSHLSVTFNRRPFCLLSVAI
jgi:hypothetical protein